MSNITSYTCTVNPYSEYNSNVVNRLTRMVSQNQDSLNSGDPIQVIRTSPVTITVKKGSCFKDDVLISINEDQEIDLRDFDFYEQGAPFDEAGKYYICIKYSYVKRMPPPEADIIILKPSQRIFFNESDYLLLKVIDVEYEEIVPVTYIFSEEFESVGIPDGWIENAGLGNVNWDYSDDPLSGNRSLRITAQESSSRYVEATVSEEGITNFYSYMMFNLIANSSESGTISQICYIYSPTGVLQARIGCIDGSLRFILGDWISNTVIYPNLPLNTVFHMWIEAEAGENILVYLNTTSEKPETPIFNLTIDTELSCPVDFSVGKLSFGAMRSGDIIIDNIFINDSPIESNPQPPTIIEDTTWKKISSSKINSYKSIVFSPKLQLFVAVGESTSDINSFATSIDGITWTPQVSPIVGQNISEETISFDWTDIVWSPELEIFVAVNKIGENLISELGQETIVISEDGFNWTPISVVDEDGYGIKLQKIVWSKEFGIFFGLPVQGNQYIISSDGTEWTKCTINDCNINQVWKDVVWCPEYNVFIIVGLNDYGTNYLISSGNIEDGLTWSDNNMPFYDDTPGSLYRVKYFPFTQTFVLFSQNHIYFSTGEYPSFNTLASWTSMPLPKELEYKDLILLVNSTQTFIKYFIIGQEKSIEDPSIINSFIYSMSINYDNPNSSVWEEEFESTDGETALENLFWFENHGLILASNYNTFNKPSSNILLYDRIDEILQNIIVQENFESEGRSENWTNSGQTYAISDWDYEDDPLNQNKSLRLVAFSSPENAQTSENISFLPVEDFYNYSIFKMKSQAIPSIGKSPIIKLSNDDNNSSVDLSWKDGLLFLDIFEPDIIDKSYQIEMPEEFGIEGENETESLFEAWDNSSIVNPSNGYWKQLAYSSTLNKYVAISEDNLAYSSDCLNWTYVDIPDNYIWSTVIWVPELEIFIAGASECTDLVITERNYFMTSVDGITWTPRESSHVADIESYEKEPEMLSLLKGMSYASSINIDLENDKLSNTPGKAFDNNDETFWMSQIDSSADFEWLAYNLDRKSSLQTIRIYSGEYIPFEGGIYDINPKDFKIQGSNNSTDGSNGTWDDLSTGLNVDGTNTWCEFSVSGEYEWIRILGLRQYIAENIYALGIFSVQVIGTPLETEEVINYNLPFTAEGNYLLYKDPKNCNDGDLNTYWRSASTENEGSLTEIIFTFFDKTIFYKMSIWGPSEYLAGEEILDNLTNATLMGYNEDTEEWETIKTGIQVQNNDSWESFIIKTNKAYDKLKIIETTKSLGGGLNTISLSEIKFQGVPFIIQTEEKIVDGLKYQSSYEGTDDVYKAFNSSTEDGWTSNPNDALNPQWIAFKPTHSTLFYKLRIYGKLIDDLDLNLKNFSIQVSENSTNGSDGTWTSIASGLNVEPNGWNEFPFKPAIYKWFRILANPGINLKLHISEIEFYGLLYITRYEIGAKKIVWSPNLNIESIGQGAFIAGTNRLQFSNNGSDWNETDIEIPNIKALLSLDNDTSIIGISSDTEKPIFYYTFNSELGHVYERLTTTVRDWIDLTFSPENNLIVVISETDGYSLISNDLGLSWNEYQLPILPNQTWKKIIWSSELQLFIAFGQGVSQNNIMTSPDGIEWTLKTNSYNFEDVIWIPQIEKFAGLGFVGLNNYSLINSDFYIRLSLNTPYHIWLECSNDEDVKLYFNTSAIKPENPIFSLSTYSESFSSSINKITLQAKSGMDIILDNIIAKNIPINSYPVIYYFEKDEDLNINYGPLCIFNIDNIDRENNRLVNFSKTRVQRIVDPEIFDEIRDPGRIVFSSLLNCYLFGLLDRWIPLSGDEIIADTTNCILNDLVYISSEDLVAYPAIANNSSKLAIGYVTDIGIFGRISLKGEFTGNLETNSNIHIHIGDSLYLSSIEEGKITNHPLKNGYKQLLGTALDLNGKLYISNFHNIHGNSAWSPPLKLNVNVDHLTSLDGNWSDILIKGLKVKTNIENSSEIYGVVANCQYIEPLNFTSINIIWEAEPPSLEFIQYSLIDHNLLPEKLPIIVEDSSYEITNENINSKIIFNNTENATLTLLDYDSVVPGSWLLIKNNSNFSVTIIGTTINDNPSGTIVLYKNDEILIFANYDNWHGKIFSDRPKTNVISSSKTLQDYDVNSLNILKSETPITINLPEASNKPNGSWLKFFNINTGPVTLTNDIDNTIVYQNQLVELYSDSGLNNKWNKPNIVGSSSGGGIIHGTITSTENRIFTFECDPPITELYPGLAISFHSPITTTQGTPYKLNCCNILTADMHIRPIFRQTSTSDKVYGQCVQRKNDIGTGEHIVAVYSGGTWNIISTMTSLEKVNFSPNGYFHLAPGNLLIQWGRWYTSNTKYYSGVTISFPISFSYACLSVSATQFMWDYWYGNEIFVTEFTKSSFRLTGAHKGGIHTRSAYWIAIGY